MRRLELVEGSHAKFWQVEAAGSELHVGWGRIGTAGQSQVKSFDSPEAAAKESEKLIAKKLQEGYREVSGSTAVELAKAAPAAATKAKKPKASKRVSDSAAAKVDTKLVTAWRKAGKLAMSRGYATLEFCDQPGAWEALEAAIDSGDVPPAACWKMGAPVTDHLPGRFAEALLRSIPAEVRELWRAYNLGASPLLRRLLEEPKAFAALELDGIAGELVELVEVQAGQRHEASDQVKATTAAWWTSLYQLEPRSIVAGRVQRAMQADRNAALEPLGEAIFGKAELAKALAAAFRERIAKSPADCIGVKDEVLEVAAPAMSPTEVLRCSPAASALVRLAAEWEPAALAEAALATHPLGSVIARSVATSGALLAIERDPSLSPKVEAALDLNELGTTSSLTLDAVWRVLTSAPTAWLRDYLLAREFSPEAYPRTYSAPLGIALLAKIDPKLADELVERHAENLDFTRIRELSAKTLLSVADAAGPRLKAALTLALLDAFTRDIAEAPERIDALVVFDGTYRDDWIVSYLVRLPAERAEKIVARERAAGHEPFLRAHAERIPRLAELLDGKPAPAPARSDQRIDLEALAGKLQQAANALAPGESRFVYLLSSEGPADASKSLSQSLGSARAVPAKLLPTFEGEEMAHVLTLDLNDAPELRKLPGRASCRAVSVFVSDLMGHAADEPGTNHAKVVWLSERDVAAALESQEPVEDDQAQAIRVRSVELPASAFGENAGELTGLLLNSSYAGGGPSWMQGEAAQSGFVLQFTDELVPMNLADAGVMYVFEDTAFVQSA